MGPSGDFGLAASTASDLTSSSAGHTMWANVAESITLEEELELAGEVAIVFCMSFVLVCSVISLANAEWEGHKDERELIGRWNLLRRDAFAGPQKHLAATSCAERVRVVETMPAPKRERIAWTENAVEGKEKRKRDGPAQQPTREGARLRGSDKPTPSRTRSMGMRRSSSHESLQLSQSSTPTRPMGKRRSSSHESLKSSPFEDLRRSSSHESLQLRQQLLSQKKELQSLTPTRLCDSSSHESLTSTEGDHFRRRHTSSHGSLASACAEGLSRTSSCTSRASSCTSDESLTSSLGSLGSLSTLSTMRRNNWSSTSLHSITEDSDLRLSPPVQ
jgi:hypothetical protein